MANPITHVYFANEVLAALPEAARAVAMRHKDAFVFGGVGPDFLFSLREMGDKFGRYCNVMQYQAMYEVFTNMADYCKQTGDARATSYALGLLCHYVLDVQIHPFVNHFVENELCKILPTNQQAGIHTLMEAHLDEVLIRERMGYPNGKGYNYNKAAKTSKKTQKAIAKLYVNTVNPHVGFPLARGKVRLALTVTMLSMRVFRALEPFAKRLSKKGENNLASGKKALRNMVRPPEFFGEKDLLNQSNHPYRAVRNREGNKTLSAIQIVDESVAIAAEYITNFLLAMEGTIPLKQEDFVVNYEGVAIE